MNRFFTLLLAASCLTAVGQVPDYVPTDGLVAWYPLDGDANDVGPNQFVGQLSGTTAYEGHLGNDSGSFWFDGDAFVHSPFSTLLTEQGVTYTAWVQRASRPGIGYIVSYGNASGSGQSFCLAEGAGDYGLFATAIGSQFDAKSGELLPLNEWTFVATTILNNEVSIYINNQVVYEVAIQQPTLQLDGDLRIGVNPSGQGEYWVGAIDDVGVWNRALSVEEIHEVFIGTPPLEGCTDESACNYDADASVDDGSCHFNCQFCHDGTVWDEDLFKCVVANPSDSNFDGCVQLNDLLDLLSAYGDCAAEESPWQCGDALEYQGYDYETVQIGEQCWFAENLRAESYSNGDGIPGGLSTSDWLATTSGAKAVYGEVADGEEDWGCETYSPDIDACDPAQSLNEFGRLYNWFAVDDARGLCPSGWHVPTDGEWTVMTDLLGGQSIAGGPMKMDYGWHEVGNGNNLSGFSGLPGGYRFPSAHYYYAGSLGFWWTSSAFGPDAWCRELNHGSYVVNRYYANLSQGYSVRCIKN